MNVLEALLSSANILLSVVKGAAVAEGFSLKFVLNNLPICRLKSLKLGILKVLWGFLLFPFNVLLIRTLSRCILNFENK